MKAVMSQKVAVVTGANRGIGFGVVKGLLEKFDGAVYLTSRDEARGKAAVAKLNALGLRPEYHQLDVTDRESVTRFRDHLKQKHGGIDILINNAAIGEGLLNSTYEKSKQIIDTNYYSIVTIQELLIPLVRDNGRILNMSSDCGHLSNVRNKHWIERLSSKDLTVDDINEFVQWYLNGQKNGTFNRADIADEGAASYRVAKVALSALTILQQKELEMRNIAVNSINLGLVKTDLTGHVGFYNIDQAADILLYVLLEAPQTLKGHYLWHNGRVMDWYNHKADYYFKFSSLKGLQNK